MQLITCLTPTLYMRVHAAFNMTRDLHMMDNLIHQDIQTLTSKSEIMRRGKFWRKIYQLAHRVVSLPLTLFRFHYSYDLRCSGPSYNGLSLSELKVRFTAIPT